MDYILDNKQYEKLNKAYQSILNTDIANIIKLLGVLISSLKNNNFTLPRLLHREIFDNLVQVKQMLNVLYIDNTNHHPSIISHNPFNLIFHLCEISQQLNSHTIKSAYQILYLKSNLILINCIKKICEYFSNKY